MSEASKRILIGFEAMAAHLGIGIHKLMRHVRHMEKSGVIERHWHGGRYYAICLPERLNRLWQERTFD